MKSHEVVATSSQAPARSMNRQDTTSPGTGRPGSDLSADLAYQDRILPGVSRTFALTIPQLPSELCRVVTNHYLLCRIADTIEDEPNLSFEQKKRFGRRFAAIVGGEGGVEEFASGLHPELSNRTLPAERELIENSPRVLRVTQSFSPRQREALARCLSIMCDGMEHYESFRASRCGLADQAEMDRYCYYVAGVVGETLTELFCDYSGEIDARRAELQELAVSFGQGLQMTNILKDVWDDHERGFCWLPQDVFERVGFDLGDLRPGADSEAFQAGLGHLIGVTHSHLRNALAYTLLLPRHEKGIRRFCLWALGMAVLTMRKIDRHRDFSDGASVKITRRTVKATVFVSNLCVGSDRLLGLLFAACARGLPRTELATN